jgi:hypothetical protein
VESVKCVFGAIIIEKISEIIEKFSLFSAVRECAGEGRPKLKSARDDMTVEHFGAAFMVVHFPLP